MVKRTGKQKGGNETDIIVTEEEAEVACAAMYGANWNSDNPLARPADTTKAIWRGIAARGIEAVDKLRNR